LNGTVLPKHAEISVGILVRRRSATGIPDLQGISAATPAKSPDPYHGESTMMPLPQYGTAPASEYPPFHTLAQNKSPIPGQNLSSDALFASKRSNFTTPSHGVMPMEIFVCISEPIDNMRDISEFLNITNDWRKVV